MTTKTYASKSNAVRAAKAATKGTNDTFTVHGHNDKGWTFQVYREVEAPNYFAVQFDQAGGHQPRGTCKALRAVATDWKGSRKDFIAQAIEAGVNSATASTQWQVARG